ncbi:MAG: acyl-CoA dehydrogenase family protein [Syntrophales bacterium]|nr:acyl-CoA dehydrogenase family protein [Syntrophales bacterium]
MNLDLTEEQEMLRRTARDFLAKEFPKTLVREMEEDPIGFRADIWKKMAELGWMGLIIPEEYDGSMGSFMDLLVLLEEMGRACLVSPFFSTAICTFPILDSGSEEQKRGFLPRIAAGEEILALALTEPAATYAAAGITTKAREDKKGCLINGTKLFVHDAQTAQHFLCIARTNFWSPPEEGITLFLVDAKSHGIRITPLPTIADDKQSEVLFDDVVVPGENMLGRLNGGWPVVRRLLERASVAKCAEMIGGTDWTVENCVAYAKERVQFGKPIGSFGIIQHYLAEMWTELGHARGLVYYAGWLLDQGFPCAREVAMAKARMSEVYRHCTRMGVQIFGGIGTTREHDMGLYYRRARQVLSLFGSPDFWREKVALEMRL